MIGKMVGIGGEPASGKSTLMKRLMEHLSPFERFKNGLLQVHRNAHLDIWGVYETGELFAGTDCLSMAVQPEAKDTIEAMLAVRKRFSIAWEGDRLFNQSWLDFCFSKEPFLTTRIYVLSVNQEELERRRSERPSRQSDIWLTGRKTKISRIISSFPRKIRCVRMEHEIDIIGLVKEIKDFLTPGL